MLLRNEITPSRPDQHLARRWIGAPGGGVAQCLRPWNGRSGAHPDSQRLCMFGETILVDGAAGSPTAALLKIRGT